MDRYFDTPDAKFDLDIFGEIFDLLIKYNDREAVKMFWSLMEEMQVEPDPEMREKVCFYITVLWWDSCQLYLRRTPLGLTHLNLCLIESQPKGVKKCRDQLDGGVHIERV